MEKKRIKTEIKIIFCIVCTILILCLSLSSIYLISHMIHQYQVKLTEVETNIKELEKRMTKNENNIIKQESEINEKDKEIKDLNSNVEELEKEKGELEKKNKKLEEELSAKKKQQEEITTTKHTSWTGNKLSSVLGAIQGPSGKETYYNLDMQYVVRNSKNDGITGEYWIRDDGVKMLGNYILAACDVTGAVRNRYDLVETSLGTAICADTGGFAKNNPSQIDIATNW